MRAALTYYGGKQRIANQIVALMPTHDLYVEPFCGGAAVFFTKPQSKISVLNDTNSMIVQFYRVLRNPEQCAELVRRLDLIPYSREEHYHYKKLDFDSEFDPIEQAIKCYIMCNWTFASKIGSGWAYGRKITCGKRISINYVKINQLMAISNHLKAAYIEHLDAIKCILTWDAPHALFYCDPPYIGTDQGTYKGYTETNYQALLDTLGQIKGKFILFGYPNDMVPKDWPYIDIDTYLTASQSKNTQGTRERRTERLWFNYELEREQFELF